MWLLPSYQNPAGLRRFLNAAREMGTSTPGLVLLNEEDYRLHRETYDELKALMPPGWGYQVSSSATCLGDILREVWPQVRDLPWVGLVCDDQVPASSLWDVELLKSVQGWNVVSSNDGWQAPQRIHGAIVWSGPFLRAVGWIFPPDLRHIFQDNIWEELGNEMGVWHRRMDVMVKHLHPAREPGYVPGPTMDPEGDLWKHDAAVFNGWRVFEKPKNLQAIAELKKAYGLTELRADFTNVKLMIGTPTGDGTYESTYQVSLWQTLEFLKGQGVTVQLAEEKYTTDVALARAHVFAAFMRSDCTHLLKIDADMGWTPEAVIRLFCAKKDFVAVAGPKKRYPLQFAANWSDERGNPKPLVFDTSTGTMEVGEVGSAFCLITRAMAQRMVDAYEGDLGYNGVTGQGEWALYQPFVRKRRYYSEDFAFARRWQDLGGRVFICPDIALKHTGKHTFEGAFATVQRDQQGLPIPAMAEAAD